MDASGLTAGMLVGVCLLVCRRFQKRELVSVGSCELRAIYLVSQKDMDPMSIHHMALLSIILTVAHVPWAFTGCVHLAGLSRYRGRGSQALSDPDLSRGRGNPVLGLQCAQSPRRYCPLAEVDSRKRVV